MSCVAHARLIVSVLLARGTYAAYIALTYGRSMQAWALDMIRFVCGCAWMGEKRELLNYWSVLSVLTHGGEPMVDSELSHVFCLYCCECKES